MDQDGPQFTYRELDKLLTEWALEYNCEFDPQALQDLINRLLKLDFEKPIH